MLSKQSQRNLICLLLKKFNLKDNRCELNLTIEGNRSSKWSKQNKNKSLKRSLKKKMRNTEILLKKSNRNSKKKEPRNLKLRDRKG